MSVIAIIAALVLEQWRPLGDRKIYFDLLADAASRLERAFNAEQGGQGLIAWLVAVVPVALAAWVLHALLHAASPLLSLLFDVAVLYLTLGFRQFSHSFTAIQSALSALSGCTSARALLVPRSPLALSATRPSPWWSSRIQAKRLALSA